MQLSLPLLLSAAGRHIGHIGDHNAGRIYGYRRRQCGLELTPSGAVKCGRCLPGQRHGALARSAGHVAVREGARKGVRTSVCKGARQDE